MARKLYQFQLEEETSEKIDALREQRIPQLSRSQYVESVLLDYMKKEEHKQSSS